jgi:hypothetical protein
MLGKAVEQRRPDGILFVGGILHPGTEEQATGLGKKDLTPDEAKLYAEFFLAVGKTDVFTALIPGYYDIPLREYLRLGIGAEVQNPKLHLVHASLALGSDFVISGMGGKLTEWVDTGEHRVRVSRGVAEYSLRMLWRAKQSRKILLLGSASSGPMGGTGEEGEIASELINSYHPHLCAVAGKTKSRGSQRIANTTIVNPGRLVDGSAAWFDWTRPRNEQVEMLDLSGKLA